MSPWKLGESLVRPLVPLEVMDLYYLGRLWIVVSRAEEKKHIELGTDKLEAV